MTPGQQGDKETGRQGDKETPKKARTGMDSATVSLSPGLLVSGSGSAVAAHAYTAISIAALAALSIVLLDRDLGIWSLFPAVVGGAALATRWGVGPVLLVVIVAGLVLAERIQAIRDQDRLEPSALNDFVLCAAAIAYAIGHYRLYGLTASNFSDTGPRRAPTPTHPRSTVRHPHLATLGAEIAVGLLAVLCCAGWALLLGRWISRSSLSWLGLNAEIWQVVVTVWLIGSSLLVVGGFLSHLRRQRMTRDEATMLLQDTLWQETRREQRRLSSWLVWGRQRRRRN